MRVLIATAYSRSAEDQKRRARFERCVRGAFRAAGAQDVSFDVRDRLELGEYVHDPEKPEDPDPETLRRFDRLDFIFVDGSHRLLPWLRAARNVMLLLKMCYHSGKVVFASNVGCQIIGFLVATDGRPVEVVNGKGRGSALAELASIEPLGPAASAQQLERQVFLDDETGDAYQFSLGAYAWIPKFNVGLHRSSTRHRIEKHHVARTVQHPPKAVYLQEMCVRSKDHLGHWLFAKVQPNRFVVPCERYWRLHAQDKSVLSVLAEAEGGQGLLVIEYGHMVGVQFEVRPDYKETIAVLEAFVAHKMALMRSHDHLEFMSQRLYQRAMRDGNALDRVIAPTAATFAGTQSIPAIFRRRLAEGQKLVRASPAFLEQLQGELRNINGGGAAAESFRLIQAGQADRAPASRPYRPKSATAVRPTSAQSRASADVASIAGHPWVSMSERPASPASYFRPSSQFAARCSTPNLDGGRADDSEDDSEDEHESRQTKMAPRPASAPPAKDRTVSFTPDLETVIDGENRATGGAAAPARSTHRVVRVDLRKRPYSAYNKHRRMAARDAHTLHRPITYDGPYQTPHEREAAERRASKAKWLGGDFKVVPTTAEQARRDWEAKKAGAFAHTGPYKAGMASTITRDEDRSKWVARQPFSLYSKGPKKVI